MTVYLKRSGRVKLFFYILEIRTNRQIRACTAGSAHLIRQTANYFSFTAIAEISMRALLTRAAAWIVARAGLGSGSTPL